MASNLWVTRMKCVPTLALTLAGCFWLGQQSSGLCSDDLDSDRPPTAGRPATEHVDGEVPTADAVEKAEAAKAKLPETFANSIGMKLALIPAGAFMMGSPDDEKGRMNGEYQRSVTIEKPFYLSVFEVTQDQYQQVMGKSPSVFRGGNRPVDSVTWTDAMAFCRALNKKEPGSYRLPTESEWEYACRAGTVTSHHFGNILTEKDANFNGRYPYGILKPGKASTGTKPVGSYKPNTFGLYDMHGNVSELCLDLIGESDGFHVVRGGSGETSGRYCRSAQRWRANQSWRWFGFRVARSVATDAADFAEIEIPVANPLHRFDRYTTDDLIAKVDEAFAKPAVKLLPPTIIFPAVDAEDRVRDDGVALSHLAMYAMVYTPQRRMNLCIPKLRHRLREIGCFRPGAVIDETTIELSLRALGAERYVLPRVVEHGAKLKLDADIRNLSDPEKTTKFARTVTADQLTFLPGMLARRILKHYGVVLTDSEKARFKRPAIQSIDDLKLFSKLLRTQEFGRGGDTLWNLVRRNFRNVSAWNLYVFEMQSPEIPLRRVARMGPALVCDRIKISVGARNLNTTQDEFLQLLDFAPEFQNDSYYHGALGRMAQRLSDQDLTNHLLTVWRKFDPEYSGCMERGRYLIDWAWKARGGGWANEVTAEGRNLFRERLAQSKSELEKAVEINSQGWGAHGKLITVAMGMSLPDRYAEEHFEEAIRLRPRYYDAYLQMFTRLLPRWGGAPEHLLAFADQCVQTGLWEDGIPQLALRCVDELCAIPAHRATRISAYADPQIWSTLKAIYEGAQENGSPDLQNFSRNLYAKYGAYGGHIPDVADLFQQIDQQGYDKRAFWEGFTYDFLRDLVFARTATGQTQIESSVRHALDLGHIDEAAKNISELKAETDAAQKRRERYRRIVKLGRQLLADRAIELTPQQIVEVFDGIDAHWHADEDHLLCRLPEHTEALIVFPIGLQNVEISGTVGWSKKPKEVRIHSHTRALRDDLSITHKPRESQVTLVRGKSQVKRKTFAGNKSAFRMILTPLGDRFESIAEVEWEAPVFESVPSGFGFGVITDEDSAVVRLSDVRIKLLD